MGIRAKIYSTTMQFAAGDVLFTITSITYVLRNKEVTTQRAKDDLFLFKSQGFTLSSQNS